MAVRDDVMKLIDRSESFTVGVSVDSFVIDLIDRRDSLRSVCVTM